RTTAGENQSSSKARSRVAGRAGEGTPSTWSESWVAAGVRPIPGDVGGGCAMGAGGGGGSAVGGGVSAVGGGGSAVGGGARAPDWAAGRGAGWAGVVGASGGWVWPLAGAIHAGIGGAAASVSIWSVCRGPRRGEAGSTGWTTESGSICKVRRRRGV